MELDTIVKLAQAEEGVLCARMIGAGFAGCAIAIVKKDSIEKKSSHPLAKSVCDFCKEKSVQEKKSWTSLVLQWIKICLLMQGHRFNPWSRKTERAVQQLSPCPTTIEALL